MENNANPPPHVPLKRRRITRACDKCHSGGLKCAPGPTPRACGPCTSFGSACTYNRPVKRRGPHTQSNLRARPGHRAPSSLHLPQSAPTAALEDFPVWQYREIASPTVIRDLVDIYYRVVYPFILYFHWPTFSADIASRRYTHDRAFFAVTMAVCATARARVQDGALPPPWLRTIESASVPTADAFHQACLDSLPTAVTGRVEFNWMRTESLLCTLCLQNNDLRGCHAHMHRYLAMCADTGFHDERRWPRHLSEIEIQERRRLFWQQYHFDVYLAVTFGSVMRLREAHCSVTLPAEVHDDQDIIESGILPRQDADVSFIRGWNFVTQLYRILEHLNDRIRSRQTYDTGPCDAVNRLFSTKGDNLGDSGPSAAEISKLVSRLYEGLPNKFKHARPMTWDIVEDRYGFQVANIIITMTTVKMVIAGLEVHSLSQRCAIAGELLDGLSNVPSEYIQASSTSMLHHLAGVGHLLGSVIHAPLSKWTYLQVRCALVAMADLVGNFGANLRWTDAISARIRDHVQRIDRYMNEATGTSASAREGLPTGESSSIATTTGNLGAMNHQPGYFNQRPDSAPGGLTDSTLPSMGLSDDLLEFQLPSDLIMDPLLDFPEPSAFSFLGLDQGI